MSDEFIEAILLRSEKPLLAAEAAQIITKNIWADHRDMENGMKPSQDWEKTALGLLGAASELDVKRSASLVEHRERRSVGRNLLELAYDGNLRGIIASKIELK